MKSFVLTIAGLFILSVSIFTLSCKKETDCKAVIKCVDVNGFAVSGAHVYLYAPVKTYTGTSVTTQTADVTASGTTDGTGTVSFLFKLPATFDIDATATLDSTAISNKGGVIKLEAGKTVDKTVTLE